MRLRALHGDTGSFKIAKVETTDADQDVRLERLLTIMNLGWFFACLLIEASAAGYAKEVESLQKPEAGKQFRPIIRKAQYARNILELLISDSQPLTICTYAYDYSLYEGIWSAADGNGLEAAVERSARRLESLMADMQTFETLRLKSLAWVAAFVGGSVAILATMISIIGYVDADTKESALFSIEVVGRQRTFAVYICIAVAVISMLLFMSISNTPIQSSRYSRDDEDRPWLFRMIPRRNKR